MTFLKTAFSLFLLFSALLLHAQPCPSNFLGSKTLYIGKQQSYKAPPKGYHAVFINYVGRHSARHLTRYPSTYYFFQTLMQADSSGGLTNEGKQLKQKVLNLDKVEKPYVKSISGSGKAELRGIGERMYANNKEVFDGKASFIPIYFTKEIRTSQSADAFIEGLQPHLSSPSFTKQINDTTLRFFDLSPAYVEFESKGDWISKIDNLKKTSGYEKLADAVCQRIFQSTFYAGLSSVNKGKIVSDLFGFITIVYSLSEEIKAAGLQFSDVDMHTFLNCDELALLGRLDDAEDFLVKGPGEKPDGLQVRVAVPLLADFINTADEFIKSKKANAVLRFAHAETISPYAALLDIQGASTSSSELKNIEAVWDPQEIICLSSNIQWIFYEKTGTKDLLVKFLLNEKEAAIKGLSTKSFPYYSWNAARAFYIKTLEHCGSNLGERGVEYLKRVRWISLANGFASLPPLRPCSLPSRTRG